MVIKKLWEYIKDHQLQDPADKRFILCDAKLKPILGNLARVSSFKMNTYLAKHMKSLGGSSSSQTGSRVTASQRSADEVVEDSSDDDDSAAAAERQSDEE
jgi:upstream activation factor subunit UAF30